MQKPDKIVVSGKSWKADAMSFGMVLMGDSSLYSENPEDNIDIHIPHVNKEDILEFLQEAKNTPLNKKPRHIVVGHEHGVENNKCHFQVFIDFKVRVQRIMKPFDFTLKDAKILAIYQPTRKTPEALAEYCRKGNDFTEWHDPDFEMKGNDETYWAQLISQSKTVSEAVESLKVNKPKDLLFFGDRIKKNFETLVEAKPVPDFEWVIPQHIYDRADRDYSTDDLSLNIEKDKCIAIRNWLNLHCFPENVARRKALFLYSIKRGVGKSQFAKRLVSDPAYYIYNRSAIDGAEFERKQKLAKLVIIDDVKFVEGDREMWKALISGEETQIVSKYYNFTFKHGLPCIIITNELSTIDFWLQSSMFNTQCVFINFDSYMGPDGTQMRELQFVETHFDPDFQTILEEYRNKKKQRKDNENFKNNFNFNK